MKPQTPKELRKEMMSKLSVTNPNANFQITLNFLFEKISELQIEMSMHRVMLNRDELTIKDLQNQIVRIKGIGILER